MLILPALVALPLLTVANIFFIGVQPPCNYTLDHHTCLRGQACTSNNTCLSELRLKLTHSQFGRDVRCGIDFGGATCQAGCCSKYGYCGITSDHCLLSSGCQSSCTGTTTPENPPEATPDTQEPVLSQPTAAFHSPGRVSTDGSCGAANGGTLCGDWPLGSCCSMYGYCGNSTSHCGDGCQSGPCSEGSAKPVPTAKPAPARSDPGAFTVVGQSGVPAMHAALMPNGRVVFLDKVENYTQLQISNGQYAYSAEFDPLTNLKTPLLYKTNAFCAGGAFLPNGQLINVGGNGPLESIDPTVGDGFDAIRYLSRSAASPSLNGQSWVEPGNKLASRRWYPSVQTLSDGTIFVASGSLNGLNPAITTNNNPTYEILNSQGISDGINRPLDLLIKAQPVYMYPFIHLLGDGNLFLFASKSSELFDPRVGNTVRVFPDLAGDYRTYPNTGGSVLLPLSSANSWDADIIICGGGAYQDIESPTDPSCGRIQPLDTNPSWEMDSMPEGRGMVEGTLLPDGTVVWLNGCNRGAQGFGLAASPTLEALIYDPNETLGQRWSTGASSTIPRLYHSVALLLLDGTIMVAGSNPVEQPVLVHSAQNPFVTEFRVEIYTPPYLQGANANKRPTNISLSTTTLRANSSPFTVTFTAPVSAKSVSVVLYHGGFVTHSLHMGQRMAVLDVKGWKAGAEIQSIVAAMPPTSNITPPGPYVIYVVCDGVPGVGQFVMVS